MAIKTRIANTVEDAPVGTQKVNDMRVCVAQWTGQPTKGIKSGSVCSHDSLAMIFPKDWSKSFTFYMVKFPCIMENKHVS